MQDELDEVWHGAQRQKRLKVPDDVSDIDEDCEQDSMKDQEQGSMDLLVHGLEQCTTLTEFYAARARFSKGVVRSS